MHISFVSIFLYINNNYSYHNDIDLTAVVRVLLIPFVSASSSIPRGAKLFIFSKLFLHTILKMHCLIFNLKSTLKMTSYILTEFRVTQHLIFQNFQRWTSYLRNILNVSLECTVKINGLFIIESFICQIPLHVVLYTFWTSLFLSMSKLAAYIYLRFQLSLFITK